MCGQSAVRVKIRKRHGNLSAVFTGCLIRNKLKARNKKGQKAAVAVANRMLTIGYALLKTGSIYRDCENYEYLERKLKTNKITAINTSMEQMLKR